MKHPLVQPAHQVILFLFAFLLVSCDDENDFNTNVDITDEFTATIPATYEPGDTVLVLNNMDSEIAAAVNGIIENEDGAELKSLEVVSIQLISSDVSQLSYMDSLALYIDRSPDDILYVTIPESAQLIATAGPDLLDQASLNMNTEQVNLLSQLGRASSYDMYIQPFLNEAFNDIEQDRILEFTITFRALIST